MFLYLCCDDGICTSDPAETRESYSTVKIIGNVSVFWENCPVGGRGRRPAAFHHARGVRAGRKWTCSPNCLPRSRSLRPLGSYRAQHVRRRWSFVARIRQPIAESNGQVAWTEETGFAGTPNDALASIRCGPLDLPEQPLQFGSRFRRTHECLADQKRMHLCVAHPLHIIRRQNAGLGHHQLAR